MDAFLNLGVFILAFYLITLYAGWPERRGGRRSDAASDLETHRAGKRVA